MAYKKPDDYKGQGRKFPMPSDDIPKEKKKELEWYLSVNQSMMADYTSNNCMIPYEWGQNRTISECRDYARGRQSSDKIKKWLIGPKRKNSDGKYLTKMNVSFDGYAKLPQLFDIMRSKNMPDEYNVDLTCIDENSVAAMEATRSALKYLIDDNTKRFLETSFYKPNFEPDPNLIGLRTARDVDMWMDTGGYALQWQMAAQAACNKTKEVSNYKEWQDRIFDDLISNPNGITGARTYIEKSTGLPKIRTDFDIEKAVVPYFEGFDSRGKITRAGYLRMMTIADIRKEAPHLEAHELLEIAKCFGWMNPQYKGLIEQDGWYGLERMGYNQSYDLDPISRVKVLCLDSQWLSADTDVYLKNDETGLVKEVASDFRVTSRGRKDGDYTVKKKTIRKYESLWIVGTEKFIHYGQCKDVVYYGEDGNKTPELDFFFVKTGNMSLVERCIGLVDDINMIIVKHRNVWATLPAAPAMAIQANLLENVFLNDVLQEPDDVIQAYIERGVLYYNGLDEFGKPLYPAGGQKPIDYMDAAKMAQMLTVCTNEIAAKLLELKEVLGLQGGADGGMRDRYQGLGETQLAFEAANASLLPTFNAFRYLFRNVFTDIIRKWQIVAKNKKIKLSYSLLGNKNMKMLELAGPFTSAEFNVRVSIAPTNAERAAMLQELKELRGISVQSGGAQGITYSEYIYVHQKVMAGNIDEAMFVLAQLEAKRKEEADEKERMNQEYTIKAQQESAAQKAEMDRTNLELKNKGQIDNTALSKTMERQNMLLELLIQGNKTKGPDGKTSEGEPDKQVAAAEYMQAEQDAMAIIESTQPQPEEGLMAPIEGEMPLQ